jgi:hypothetical protein
MKLSPRRAKILAESLRALRSGDGKRFDDLLWLGLGDACAEVYEALTKNGYIENETDLEHVRLTDRGQGLLHRLTESILLVA